MFHPTDLDPRHLDHAGARPSQLRLSRDAAARAELTTALRERRRAARGRPLVHRVRHALALRLIHTALLVDVR